MDRPADDGCGRSGGCATRRGNELSHLEGEVRFRPFDGRRQLPDKRSSVHGDRRGGAGLLRGEAGRLGYAGFLDTADDRTIDRR